MTKTRNIGTLSALNYDVATETLDINSTGAFQLPSGNTAQRPTPANGMIRYNETGGAIEGHVAGEWKTLSPNVNNAVTAAGTVQGDATALSVPINVVSTVASGTGVVFPTAIAGFRYTVFNTGANALKIYPASGAQINALGANVAFTLAVDSGLDFVATSATQWRTLNAVYA